MAGQHRYAAFGINQSIDRHSMSPYLQLISYIVVIASTVQLVEMVVIKKMSPTLFRQPWESSCR